MISAYNVGNFNAGKQGVKSNYLVYAEDADKNHDVVAFVINTYNLYI